MRKGWLFAAFVVLALAAHGRAQGTDAVFSGTVDFFDLHQRSLTVQPSSGLRETFRLHNMCPVIIDGSEAAASDLARGFTVEVTYDPRTSRPSRVQCIRPRLGRIPPGDALATGTISDVDFGHDSISLSAESGSMSIRLGPRTCLTIDYADAPLAKLEKGQEATVVYARISRQAQRIEVRTKEMAERGEKARMVLQRWSVERGGTDASGPAR